MTVLMNIPKLGMSMTEATLVAWLVDDGASVTKGDAICTIETDKVEQEIEAPASGTLVHKAEVGESYPVGDPLAEIG
jgi:2-oxoglutarate dehydrogenase E2 component (dihydrolipoamide succinyltransferase)